MVQQNNYLIEQQQYENQMAYFHEMANYDMAHTAAINDLYG